MQKQRSVKYLYSKVKIVVSLFQNTKEKHS